MVFWGPKETYAAVLGPIPIKLINAFSNSTAQASKHLSNQHLRPIVGLNWQLITQTYPRIYARLMSLGILFRQAVDAGGNAAKAGLKAGDQVLYTSSFFGDELWPADKLGFTKTAIQAKPDSVYFVVSRQVTPRGLSTVFYCSFWYCSFSHWHIWLFRNCLTLVSVLWQRCGSRCKAADEKASSSSVRPDPDRSSEGEIATNLQITCEQIRIPFFLVSSCDFVSAAFFQARATHICLDCGYIYTLQKPFDEQVIRYSDIFLSLKMLEHFAINNYMIMLMFLSEFSLSYTS